MINVDNTACTRCNKVLKHILNAFDGTPYCVGCGNNHLARSTCSRCGGGIRHGSDQAPKYCYKCADTDLWLGKSCCNCNRLAMKKGRSHLGQVYCKNCKYLAIPDRACSYCDYVGKRVHTALPRGLDQPACPACRSKGRPVCLGCNRSRKVVGTIDGKNVCRECLARGALDIIACPKCGLNRPAAVGDRCMGCMRLKVAETMKDKLAETLSQPWVRDLLQQFFKDIHDRTPTGIISLLKSNAEGFRVLDETLGDADELDEAAVLRSFHPRPLTRFMGIKEWLTARHGMDFKSESCLHTVHLLKMNSFLNTVEASWIRTLAGEFHAALLAGRAKRIDKRVGRTRFPMQFSSIRGAVIKAVQFMEHCASLGGTSRADLTEEALDDYAVQHERTWHVLGAFVRYWNRRVVSFQRLELPKTPGRRDNPVLILSDDVRSDLINRWLSVDDGIDLRSAVFALLMLTYAQPAKRIACLRFDNLTRVDGVLSLDFGKGPIEIEPVIAERLDLWLAQRIHHSVFRDVAASPFLFPGRTARAGVSAATISAWCVSQGATLRQIGATAINRFYARGLTDPTQLTEILGVKPATAMLYWYRSGAHAATHTYTETFGALREAGQLEKPK